MRSRGPTKRCITLPGVNKPRGLGLARGSPLRLRLLHRLCISSAAVPPPRSLSSTNVATTIFFPFLLSLSLASAPSRSPWNCTKTADNTLSRSFSLFSPWLVGHPQIIFSRENTSGRSAAAIFSNLLPSYTARTPFHSSTSNHATTRTQRPKLRTEG